MEYGPGGRGQYLVERVKALGLWPEDSETRFVTDHLSQKVNGRCTTPHIPLGSKTSVKWRQIFKNKLCK